MTIEQQAREAAKAYTLKTWSGGSRFHVRDLRVYTKQDYVAGFLAAAEPREKRIAELESDIRDLRRRLNGTDDGDLWKVRTP